MKCGVLFENDELYNDETIKSKVYIDITSKVLHSRVNVYVKSYNHAHFSRSVLKNNRDNSMRREFLKQTSLPNPSKTKKKSK